jgi:hypothetical protein
MSWRDISHEALKKFCGEWRCKKDFMETFSFSESEARHCFNYLKKLKNDFLFREKMNDKRRRCNQIISIK